MSDNSTNTTVENKLEGVTSADAVADTIVGVTSGESADTIVGVTSGESADTIVGVSVEGAVADTSVGVTKDKTDPDPDRGRAQVEVSKESPKKKSVLKSILAFAQNKIFTPKVCNIILMLLGALIAVLCLVQIVFWGLSIKDTYLNYWGAIKALDYLNIAIIAFMALFVVVLFISAVHSIVSLLKKEHEARFETVSTLFAFYLFSIFVTKFFSGTSLLISNFKFEPLLKIIVILVFVYAFIRLFVKDFGSRICPLAFSCGAIGISIIMFTQNIGNFATFTIGGGPAFQLSELNAYRYIQSIIAFSNENTTSSFESVFLEVGAVIDIEEFIGIDLGEGIVTILLQFVPIMVSNILPYAAISLLGYLMFCLVSGNHIQYYNLQTCKKISITMLVASIFSAAAVVCLHFICKLTNAHLAVQLDYTNMVVTMVLCIVMIVLTSLPWKIYNVICKHRYASYQKSEGGK